MFDFSKIPSTFTKEEMLKVIGEEELWKLFIPQLTFSKLISSPLREDKNPSFCVYNNSNRIIYVDFSTGSTGDIFKFVMDSYNVNFYKAIEIINARIRKENLVPSKEIKTLPKETRDYKYHFIPRNYNLTDANYWNQYGITFKMLCKFNVKCVKNIYFISKEHFFNMYYYNEDDPCYVIEDSRFYRPLNNKGEKWFGRMKKDLHGCHTIDFFNSILFITSSCKDAMVLNTLGYNAIYPSTETMYIDEEQINQFKENFKIILFYDNDKPGIESAQKQCSRLNLTYIHTPIGESKDPSDYVKDHGINELGILIEKLLWGN